MLKILHALPALLSESEPPPTAHHSGPFRSKTVTRPSPHQLTATSTVASYGAPD